ncbi:hypothetical protein U3516DRAFT_749207 [Neocallimastix sp. 'constans']
MLLVGGDGDDNDDDGAIETSTQRYRYISPASVVNDGISIYFMKLNPRFYAINIGKDKDVFHVLMDQINAVTASVRYGKPPIGYIIPSGNLVISDVIVLYLLNHNHMDQGKKPMSSSVIIINLKSYFKKRIRASLNNYRRSSIMWIRRVTNLMTATLKLPSTTGYCNVLWKERIKVSFNLSTYLPTSLLSGVSVNLISERRRRRRREGVEKEKKKVNEDDDNDDDDNDDEEENDNNEIIDHDRLDKEEEESNTMMRRLNGKETKLVELCQSNELHFHYSYYLFDRYMCRVTGDFYNDTDTDTDACLLACSFQTLLYLISLRETMVEFNGGWCPFVSFSISPYKCQLYCNVRPQQFYVMTDCLVTTTIITTTTNFININKNILVLGHRKLRENSNNNNNNNSNVFLFKSIVFMNEPMSVNDTISSQVIHLQVFRGRWFFKYFFVSKNKKVKTSETSAPSPLIIPRFSVSTAEEDIVVLSTTTTTISENVLAYLTPTILKKKSSPAVTTFDMFC